MNASQFTTNFDVFSICQMGIKYRVKPRVRHAKMNTDFPKTSAVFALNKVNAITETIDLIKEITKEQFFQLNEERI